MVHGKTSIDTRWSELQIEYLFFAEFHFGRFQFCAQSLKFFATCKINGILVNSYAESRPKNLNDMYIVNELDSATIFKCNFFSYFSADPEGPGCCALVRFSILMK